MKCISTVLPVTALIWASPRLEEIKIKRSDCMDGVMMIVVRSPHQHLKVFAFQMSSWQCVGIHDRIVELVTCILDNCMVLQKIIIGSLQYHVSSAHIKAGMQADTDNLMQQLQAKVPNHIQLELKDSIE